MRNTLENYLRKYRVSGWIGILFLSIVPLFSLLRPGLPVTHDGQDHVARIANFAQSLSEGNLVPRWAGNLNWGFGHPVLMFLYPLPSYAASALHHLGISLVDSTKLVFALSYIASIAAMFLWAKTQWGENAGVVAGVLYGFAPYRFVDLYVRGALGEHVAFVFPPLILYGLLGLARAEKKFAIRHGVTLALGTAGLIASHNAVSLMFLPIVALYAVFLFFFETEKRVSFLVLGSSCIVLGFTLSAFYWFPAFFEGKYTLRNIVTEGEYASRFVTPSQFIYSPWNYGGGNEFTKQVGLVQWMMIGGSLWVMIKAKEKKTRWLTGFLFTAFALSLFLQTQWSLPVWSRSAVLSKFQFPWRWLSVSVFTASALGGAVIAYLSIKNQTIATRVFAAVAILSTWYMWKPVGYRVFPENFFASVYDSTTDTGESSPIWSVRFMEKRASKSLDVIDGRAEIREIVRRSTKHEYEVVAKDRTRLVENTLYFPGWNVLVDGQPVPVEFQDPAYRGLMTFFVEKGKHGVVIFFGDTKLRTFANAVSVVSVVILFALGFTTVRRQKNFM